SSRRRHTRFSRDWSSDVCSSDLRCILIQIITTFVGMTAQQREMIVGDFERYMRYIQSQNRAFTLADFVTFATSLINFYSGSQLIDTAERKDTALILSSSFNK